MKPAARTLPAPIARGSLFSGYQPPPGVYDELKDAAGHVRPHWKIFVETMAPLGFDALRERQEAAQQLLRDHGVTYNVYADGGSDERPWKLDMLPLLIGAEEWRRLEAGLIQRTRLLDRVLADIYGPQQLVRDGLLPPAFLHANVGFIRPCHGVRPPSDQFLNLHAVDLTRAPNGEWWVLGDRTQAPSGLGYAMENRFILSRVMAEEFRASSVRRIASFFLARHGGLRAMAPWTDTPQIVLLTPGPRTETYFEHAYLARYFGHALVEGSDLTVRDRRVFIKTIEGLRPVDVIIRRVDDTYCDPLELRSNSFLGVPGLVEAARARNISISNALGSGAVEAPALLAFLPALARALLGEELHIPNVATWWFGQERERAQALAQLPRMVVKRAFTLGRGDPEFGEMLDEADIDALAARIRAHPHDFVAQERVALSTAPVWTGGKIEPRPLILRCFVGVTQDGYTVFPGGLTRVSATPVSPIVTSTHGGSSKDTWIISDAPVEELMLRDIRGFVAEQQHRTPSLPSRIVDNFFWLGRYAERLEDNTRLIRTVLARMAGEGGTLEVRELTAMVHAMVKMTKLHPSFAGAPRFSDLAAAMRELIFDKGIPDSMRGLLDSMAYLAASLRDRFSGDTWRILHQLQSDFPAPPLHFTPGGIIVSLHRLIFQLAALSGMELENMTRGHAWRFLEIGRRIERATNVMEVIRAMIASEPDGGPALAPLLEYCDSTMTYRRRYLGRPELPAVLDLLVADALNPRAVAFQISALGNYLRELPGADESLPERRAFAEIEATLHAADLSALGAESAAGRTGDLDTLLRGLAEGCRAISDALTSHYFSLVFPTAN
ncbi:MAG TPA: circularly permuted type 2 ATP-grasp protein [Chthoniobacteraceae bacterium]|jgi:uncharacterized circularly permuted ATP-grasp superfamily protein/uncharacterized alpha-E superfamily protein|nr:circularly permuted type 2 ATP-grasp protein [Chthoniobacteraceae bacterium]